MPDTRTCLCCGVNLDGTTKAWCDYCFVGLAEDGKHTCRAEPAPEPSLPQCPNCHSTSRVIRGRTEGRFLSCDHSWHGEYGKCPTCGCFPVLIPPPITAEELEDKMADAYRAWKAQPNDEPFIEACVRALLSDPELKGRRL